MQPIISVTQSSGFDESMMALSESKKYPVVPSVNAYSQVQRMNDLNVENSRHRANQKTDITFADPMSPLKNEFDGYLIIDKTKPITMESKLHSTNPHETSKSTSVENLFMDAKKIHL